MGYPLHIFLLSRRNRNEPESLNCQNEPMVSIVIVVHNEQERILPRLRNLLACDYPQDRREFIVVSDGSDDETVARARSLRDVPCLTIIENRRQRGKPSCLNDGISAAKGDIVVFADARQRFEAKAIRSLVGCFDDATVGAVSGELLIEDSTSGLGSSVDAYWRLEKMIRRAEAKVDSCIGCTGAIYAIRRGLYQSLPQDTLLDDVVTPMLIAISGYRIHFTAEARAYDPQSLEPERESMRKRRTLAGNFQMLFRYPSWLLPWKNRLWWMLLAHKYLRLSAPLLLMALFVSNCWIAPSGRFYAVVLSAQIMFYSSAAIGILIPELRMKAFCMPAGFVFLNIQTLRGFIYYLSRHGKGGW